jgi:uncharacterized protein (TIGR00730 family)
MRISVYCSSSPTIDQKFIDLAYDLGQGIAARGWELVWGGGKVSMMGAVARGARDGGAKTWGVIPESLLSLEFGDEQASEMFVTADMRSRKAKLEELSDAFIALPGSLGTLEELFEIWVGRYLNFHAKPVVILDPQGVYGPLRQALDHLASLEFMKPGQAEQATWTTGIERALDACAPAI